MQKSIISWTSVTWNPVFGCSRVSEGCRHCYAEAIALKFGHSKKPWTGANAAENIVLKPHKLNEPLKLKQPSRIFVNSMSDLFHEQVPDAYIAKVFSIMRQCPQHVFQILTKRPERAAQWEGPWDANIWMGTSIEDARAVHRIDALRGCGAQIRFISAEPLLGDLGTLDLWGIHWVIVGGESGREHRPLDMAWARRIKDQCVSQGVAYFFKQDSGHRTELRPWLIETDGSRWSWQQFPDKRNAPQHIDDQPKKSETHPSQLLLL